MLVVHTRRCYSYRTGTVLPLSEAERALKNEEGDGAQSGSDRAGSPFASSYGSQSPAAASPSPISPTTVAASPSPDRGLAMSRVNGVGGNGGPILLIGTHPSVVPKTVSGKEDHDCFGQ